MSFFRKKPVVVEAVRYNRINWRDILEFIGETNGYWNDGVIVIHTLEGNMVANPGDWIIKGVKGEFYPCRNDIFEATYEPEPEAGKQWQTIQPLSK